MKFRNVWVLVVSLATVLSGVPTPALAEAALEARSLAPALELRINVQDDEAPWTSFASCEDAEALGADDGQSSDGQTEAQIVRLELRAAQGLEGAFVVSTLAPGEPDADGSWSECAYTQSADIEGPFVGLAFALEGDPAETYDLIYRVHGAGAGWSQWVQNGEHAVLAPDATLDDLQVVVAAKPAEQPESDGAVSDGEQDATDAEQDGADDGQDEAAPTTDGQETNTEESLDNPADDTSAEEHVEGQEASAEEVKKDSTASAKKTSDKKTDAASKGTSAAQATSDEEGIVAQALPEAPTVTYQAHVQRIGWQGNVANGAVAGTTGKSLRVEALRITLPKGANGGITYQGHVQSYGWQNWVKDGETVGTTGHSKRMEALKIKLYGKVADTFDVWYRVHGQSYGWQDWVKNGALAGTTGKSKRLEAVQVVLMPKGSSAPRSADEATVKGSDNTTRASINYHVSTFGTGWQGWVCDGDTAGAQGLSAFADGFSAQLSGLAASELSYCAYVGGGWQGNVSGGQTAGKPGSRKYLEAIKMSLSGKAAQLYDVYYRVYAGGWTGWAKNGAPAGSTGLSRGVEAVQARLVTRGGKAPGSTANTFTQRPVLRYCGHAQRVGWQGWVSEGATAGTTGRGLRLEALQTQVSSAGFTGELQVEAHVQRRGWMGYKGGNATAGTTGQGLRVEAFRMRLTGQLAQSFDVYYRVHARHYGWLGWAKNGANAGTTGLSLRLEAVQIRLVKKGGSAPGSTARPFIDGAGVTKLGYQNPAGFYQVSRKNVTITSAARAPWNYITPSRIGLWASRQDCVNAFLQRAREYLGTGYVWNYSCAPGVGVDCIGLVYQCAYACGMDLGGGTGYNDFNPWAHWITGSGGWHSHDANNFWSYGKAMHVGVGSRRPGDVMYYPGHVSIYVGNDTVIEAYPNRGVTYAGMSAHGYPAGCIRLFQ